MSEKELERTLAALNRVDQENDTREKSLAFLVRAGIATPEGRLTEPYRELSRQ